VLLDIANAVAIVAQAMSAALAAGKRRLDWFGVASLGCVTALGGGSVRDVVLGHYPLPWVAQPWLLLSTCSWPGPSAQSSGSGSSDGRRQ